jgi:hypothetical protein
MNVRDRVAKVVGTILGIVLSILLLVGCGALVLNVAGPAVGGVVGDMFGPWSGIYHSDYSPANDTATFSSPERCIAWGLREVKKNGGSFQCGRDCERKGVDITTLTCAEVRP